MCVLLRRNKSMFFSVLGLQNGLHIDTTQICLQVKTKLAKLNLHMLGHMLVETIGYFPVWGVLKFDRCQCAGNASPDSWTISFWWLKSLKSGIIALRAGVLHGKIMKNVWTWQHPNIRNWQSESYSESCRLDESPVARKHLQLWQLQMQTFPVEQPLDTVKLSNVDHPPPPIQCLMPQTVDGKEQSWQYYLRPGRRNQHAQLTCAENMQVPASTYSTILVYQVRAAVRSSHSSLS